MAYSFWQSARNLVAAGFIGISAVAAGQLYGQQPTELLSYDEVDNQSGQTQATATAFEKAGTCDLPAGCCDDNCGCVGNWLDNTQVWFGGEAYKGFGDSAQPPGPFAGFMDSFGLVTGFNTGVALGESRVRGQIGASYGAYDFKGRDTTEPDSLEQQVYLTGGFYKRSDIGCDDRISWGLVYDQFFGHQWGLLANEVSLGQVRGLLGYALSECNEVGVWGTFHVGQNVLQEPEVITPSHIRAMNQANFYLRHNFDFGGNAMVYVGTFDAADVGSWQFGFLGDAPLNDNVSLYANFNLASPGSATGPVGSNEEQWNIGLGLMYSFGGKAVADTVSGQAGLPLMPVANNGSLLITN